MKKKNNIILYMLKILLIFISINLFLIFLSSVLGIYSLNYKYGVDYITEMIYALLVLIIMLLFKNDYVFTQKKDKFFTGIKLGLPMLVLSVIIMISNIISLEEFHLIKFINVLLLSLFVGIAEEFLCRGWLQNEFIEKYSKNKKMVLTSIVLSSLVFGFMHILNLGAQSLFETILQVINALGVGFLLGVLYYKTKNIWSVIFLHSFYDFAIFLGQMNDIKDCTYGTPTTPILIVESLSIIFINFLWISAAVKVIQKCDFPDQKASKEKTNPYLNALIWISLIMVLTPFENLVYGYDEYQTCYNYETKKISDNYEVHYPNYDRYLIDGITKDITYEETDSNKEVVNLNNYSYEFYIEKYEVYLENKNTGYKVKFDYDDVSKIEVIKNESEYMLLIHTYENESTIYYSDYIVVDNMSNENDYLDSIKNSFIKFEFPELSSVGYITIDNKEEKYPLMSSSNNEYFIIENRKLYLVE